MRPIPLQFALYLFLSVALPAAPITWGPATPVADANDVSTQGTTVEAFNAGADNAGNVVANGVTFLGTSSLLDSSNTIDVFNGSTGDAGYDTLLSNVDFGNGGGLITLTIGNGSSRSRRPLSDSSVVR